MFHMGYLPLCRGTRALQTSEVCAHLTTKSMEARLMINLASKYILA